MTIYIRIEHFPITQMRFHYSVLHEVLLSLRVLDDYGSYPLHMNWSLKTLRSLSPELHQERDFFRVLISTLITVLWDADAVEESTFDRELAQFASRPLEAFTTPIVSRLIMEQSPAEQTVIPQDMTVEELKLDPMLQEHARLWLTDYFPESEALLDDLLEEGQAVKDRFVQFLQQYWEAHFSEFWMVHEPYFVSDIEKKGQLLFKKGVLDVLKTLSPDMQINEVIYMAHYAVIGEKGDFRLTEHDILTLHPSFFTYPKLLFTSRPYRDEHLALSIMYPMKAAYEISTAPVMAEELVQILQGISDPTRLQILQLVAQRPRSTQEIAQLLNLSQAAISKHLKLLKAAGWVTSARDSYYVLYRATKNPLPILNRGLEDILT